MHANARILSQEKETVPSSTLRETSLSMSDETRRGTKRKAPTRTSVEKGNHQSRQRWMNTKQPMHSVCIIMLLIAGSYAKEEKSYWKKLCNGTRITCKTNQVCHYEHIHVITFVHAHVHCCTLMHMLYTCNILSPQKKISRAATSAIPWVVRMFSLWFTKQPARQ